MKILIVLLGMQLVPQLVPPKGLKVVCHASKRYTEVCCFEDDAGNNYGCWYDPEKATKK
jgi:hypothetical protein